MKAELRLQTALRNGITILKDCYFTKPFKIANIREDKRDPELKLMLMSSSPGILNGDSYHISIELEENTALGLWSQSYQRLFTMEGQAEQLFEIRLQARSFFKYIPLPVVPHKNSAFASRNSIYLSATSTLIWGEILTCGRKLNGEQFEMKKYHSLTSVYLEDKLIVRENLLIQPDLLPVNVIGQYEGYTHQGSLLLINGSVDVKEVQSVLLGELNSQEIILGVTEAPENAILVRVMGNKAEMLHKVLLLAAEIFESAIKEKVLI